MDSLLNSLLVPLLISAYFIASPLQAIAKELREANQLNRDSLKKPLPKNV